MTTKGGRPRTPEEAVRVELKNVRNMLYVARRDRDFLAGLVEWIVSEVEGRPEYGGFSDEIVGKVEEYEKQKAASVGESAGGQKPAGGGEAGSVGGERAPVDDGKKGG